MLEPEKVQRRVNFKAFAILGAILLIAGVVWYFSADANQSPIDRALAGTTEKPPVQEASSTTPQAPDSGTQSDPAPPAAPKADGCWGTSMPQIFKKDAATRQQFADDSTERANTDLGIGSVFTNVKGDDNQYLLFIADPEHEAQVAALADGMQRSLNIRANLCTQGFAEVQFIVRDSSGNQRLLAKIHTKVTDAMNYYNELDAKPM